MPKAHVIALGAVDPAGLELGLEQDVAGVEIAQPDLPRRLALRQHHPAAVIEIEPKPLRPFLRRIIRRRRKGPLDRLRGCAGRCRKMMQIARWNEGERRNPVADFLPQ